MSTDERLPEGAATLAMRRCALQALYQLDAGQSDDVALVGVLAAAHLRPFLRTPSSRSRSS